MKRFLFALLLALAFVLGMISGYAFYLSVGV